MSSRGQASLVNGAAIFVFVVVMVLSAAIAVVTGLNGVHWEWLVGEILALNFLGVYFLLAFKLAEQWEKAIVLRLGRFVGPKGVGPF